MSESLIYSFEDNTYTLINELKKDGAAYQKQLGIWRDRVLKQMRCQIVEQDEMISDVRNG